MDFTNLKRILFSRKDELNVIEKFNQFKYHYYILICILFIISSIISLFLTKNINSLILSDIAIFLVLVFFSSRIIVSYHYNRDIDFKEFSEKIHYISFFLFVGFILLVTIFR